MLCKRRPKEVMLSEGYQTAQASPVEARKKSQYCWKPR